MKVHLEYQDDRSSKFWEVEVKGAAVTVRYGRIGTAGQAKTKSHSSAAAAESAAQKQVAAKLRKGYVQTNALSPAAAASAKPTSAKATPETPVTVVDPRSFVSDDATKLTTKGFKRALSDICRRLVRPPYNYKETGNAYHSVPFLRETKYEDLPEFFHDLFMENMDDIPIANFINVLLSAHLHPPATGVAVSGDLDLRKVRPYWLVLGDLHVQGHFSYDGPVFVLGDLHVEGMIRDTFEYAPLCIAGDVKTESMCIGSEVWVGGKLDAADLVYLRFTRGGQTLSVESGISTGLLIQTPCDSSFQGTLSSGTVIDADTNGSKADFRRSVEHAKKVLRDDSYAVEDDWKLNFRNLIDMLKKRESVWKD